MSEIKRHHGVFRGVVQDNNDPTGQRRIRVSVPQITGSEFTDWVYPVEPHGIHVALPKVGQGVWVSYISGDPEHPIWHGSFGKHQENSKPISISTLPNTVSVSSLSNYLIIKTEKDGTQTIDLTATLLAMAQSLKDHETRIQSLESQLSTLHTTLATRTSTSHTHGSNG
jgi:uncharacterized protein involved in type VI secretion and phage assembly